MTSSRFGNTKAKANIASHTNTPDGALPIRNTRRRFKLYSVVNYVAVNDARPTEASIPAPN